MTLTLYKVLVSLLISLSFVTFKTLVSYLAISLTGDFFSILFYQLKRYLVPLFVISLVCLVISPWLLIFVPVVYYGVYFIGKELSMRRMKKRVEPIKKGISNDLELWISKQDKMTIKKYFVDINRIEKYKIKGLISLHISSDVDYSLINELKSLVPDGINIQINVDEEKKTPKFYPELS
ncbi:hypothetical protein [Priestia megaterium]|uniref:hypothetical protein n=1 Tax=Priestia megaterium TaxID=1404 RepID=UPI000BFBD14D|nr:hypothetical protein [Priestia megaterium]PGQ79685.1 hypothetical protein COA18_27935 [Priestia megaterium]